jgi:hypothetical protein
MSVTVIPGEDPGGCLPGFDADAVPFPGRAGPLLEAWKLRQLADGELKGRGDAYLVHDTAQNLFQSVMAQLCLCREGRALHSVVHARAPEGRAAFALHRGRLGGRMVVPRWWRRPLWNSPLLSSRACVNRRVSSQQRRALARSPSSVAASREANRAVVRFSDG